MINLATVWGLSQERSVEAVGREARTVVMQAQMKRTSFKGVVDVIYGGERPQQANDGQSLNKKGQGSKNKRKAEVLDSEIGSENITKPLSKRQMKKLAKQANADATKAEDSLVK